MTFLPFRYIFRETSNRDQLCT